MIHSTLPNRWSAEDILGLSLIKGVRNNELRNFVERYQDLEHLLEEAPDKLLRLGITSGGLFAAGAYSYVRNLAEQQLERCRKESASIITFWHEEYPTLLREIYYPPTVLFVQGNLASQPHISIVGTRRCSQYGESATELFVHDFVTAGLTIVSGLAQGIDTKAHKKTLAVGGITYAVIASGVDKISPSTAKVLAREIVAKGGAVISEYPCGTLAHPSYFPQRNRIISGLSPATLIVESGAKGGSLITAKFALDQNRDVFAVPGTIFASRSNGCNVLIRQNLAQLASSPADVLATYGISQKQVTKAAMPEVSPEQRQILSILEQESLHIDAIAEKSGMPGNELVVHLLELEFSGFVRQLPGKVFELCLL